jgi:hypothetical protein
VVFRIRLTMCSSCSVLDTGGCQRNGCICSLLASRLFQTYSCQGQREKQVHFSHRSNLPLMPFRALRPDTCVWIGRDHPDGQSELNHGTPHPKQVVPERIGRWQHPSNLQESNWDLEGGEGCGHQHEPEDESENCALPQG